MRDLQWITESVARARIVAYVISGPRGAHTVASLAKALGLSRSPTRREVRRLVQAGFMRASRIQERRSEVVFEVDPDQAGTAELRRFVQLSVGEAGLLRETILACDPRSLAWIYGPYAEGRAYPRDIRLVILTSDRQAVANALTGVAGRLSRFRIASDVMSPKEWTYRLQRREFRALRLRRTQRMWLVGSDEDLRREGSAVVTAKRTLNAAIANWREELSDDWDDSWDPFNALPAFPGPSR
jgi:DNA-binding Lrp family transcriptional regulator